MKGNEDCNAYLIYFNDKIAGFVTLEPTNIVAKEMIELSDIFIMPKYRHRGLAQYTVEKLMMNDVKEWHIAIYEDDNDAHQFWQALFQKLSIEKCYKVAPSETEGFHEYVVVNA